MCSATRINLHMLYRRSRGEWIFHFGVQSGVTQAHTLTYERSTAGKPKDLLGSFFFFFSLFSPLYQITLFNSPPSVLWYLRMIWRGVSDPDSDVRSSLMTCWAADVACFDIVFIKLSAGSTFWHCSAQKAPHDRDVAVNHGWYSGNTICNPWVLMPCSAHWALQDK